MRTVKYEQMEPDLRRAEGKTFDERLEKKGAEHQTEKMLSRFYESIQEGLKGLNGEKAVDWYLRKTASGYRVLPVVRVQILNLIFLVSQVELAFLIFMLSLFFLESVYFVRYDVNNARFWVILRKSRSG